MYYGNIVQQLPNKIDLKRLENIMILKTLDLLKVWNIPASIVHTV